MDEEHLGDAGNLHGNNDVELYQRDFLANVDDLGEFEYVIGNPPYVPIEELGEGEKKRYKRNLETATGGSTLRSVP
jgi:adenine-specific DNA-methyltransferase